MMGLLPLPVPQRGPIQSSILRPETRRSAVAIAPRLWRAVTAPRFWPKKFERASVWVSAPCCQAFAPAALTWAGGRSNCPKRRCARASARTPPFAEGALTCQRPESFRTSREMGCRRWPPFCRRNSSSCFCSKAALLEGTPSVSSRTITAAGALDCGAPWLAAKERIDSRWPASKTEKLSRDSPATGRPAESVTTTSRWIRPSASEETAWAEGKAGKAAAAVVWATARAGAKRAAAARQSLREMNKISSRRKCRRCEDTAGLRRDGRPGALVSRAGDAEAVHTGDVAGYSAIERLGDALAVMRLAQFLRVLRIGEERNLREDRRHVRANQHDKRRLLDAPIAQAGIAELQT